MSQTNAAAWITASGANPLQVKEAPYPTVGAKELVIKNHAVAINPVDYMLQDFGNLIFKWIKYPAIFGSDLAGEVMEVGSEVSDFKKGDRVLAMAVGCDPDCNDSAAGAFQNCTVVRADLTSKIPSSLDYVHASVLPLCLSTAASGLFQKDYLGLQLPSEPAKPPTGETLIIWGGSTSVGSNAIQLAVAAGYEVISTASPKNFEYVEKLGATQVFDYNSKSVVQDMISSLKDKTVAGAVAIGTGSLHACVDILSASKGSKFITDISGPGAPKGPPTGLNLVRMMGTMIYHNVSIWTKSRLAGVSSKFVWGSDLKKNEVGPAIFAEFLPKALESGSYIIAPDPEVVGHGLDQIQNAFDILRKGVSAKKLVVTLQ
ncbi:hypothetical protein INT43_003431 [Umbelopsis isabellina]|uniref:Enoyl reductase (ER) domain-containing protein n=1 Tax=Mortierella isabellina TaxID=91625 RepID=A0A8H7UFP4_MORIS|nr:hypothetical protein INT43_003431 [Umbelopsis isabellina]